MSLALLTRAIVEVPYLFTLLTKKLHELEI